jgi:hypothetical protein
MAFLHSNLLNSTFYKKYFIPNGMCLILLRPNSYRYYVPLGQYFTIHQINPPNGRPSGTYPPIHLSTHPPIHLNKQSSVWIFTLRELEMLHSNLLNSTFFLFTTHHSPFTTLQTHPPCFIKDVCNF